MKYLEDVFIEFCYLYSLMTLIPNQNLKKIINESNDTKFTASFQGYYHCVTTSCNYKTIKLFTNSKSLTYFNTQTYRKNNTKNSGMQFIMVYFLYWNLLMCGVEKYKYLNINFYNSFRNKMSNNKRNKK